MRIKQKAKVLKLNKQTISNLRNSVMNDVLGGGLATAVQTKFCTGQCETWQENCPTCQYPTLDAVDCGDLAPSVYTCGGGRCHLMSVVPV